MKREEKSEEARRCPVCRKYVFDTVDEFDLPYL